MTNRIGSRLDRLESNSGSGGGSDRGRRDYHDAITRTHICILIGLGFEFQDSIMQDFEDYSEEEFAADEATIAAFEDSLTAKGLFSATERGDLHRRGRERQLSGMIRQAEDGGAKRLFREAEVFGSRA